MKKIKYCKKRDGRVVLFEKTKIVNAVHAAFEASGEGNRFIAQQMAETIMEAVLRVYRDDNYPDVEQIQDFVEDGLMEHGHIAAAKSYIKYREMRKQIRKY